MSLPLLAKIVNFDPVTNLITFKASFLDEDHLKVLEEAVISGKLIKLEIKFRIRVLKTYNQLKRFFAMVKAILLGVKESPNSENVKLIRQEYVARKYFKQVNNRNIDLIEKVNNASATPENFDVNSVQVRSLATLSKEEINEVMQDLEQDYLEIFSNKELWNYEN
jgi:hypothetical protein